MALQIVKDFEHSAIEKAKVHERENLVTFRAPLDDSPRGMWFHFKVSGGDGSPVTFVLINRDQMLGGPSFSHAAPVYRPAGGDWQRVDPESCVSAEPSDALFGAGVKMSEPFFRFEIPCGPDETDTAYSPPYTIEMIDAALEKWGGARNVEITQIGKTAGGRPLRVLRVGKPSKNKKLVWVLARQHAGEMTGSFAAEGLVDAVLGKTKWSESFRRRVTLYVCPAVDVDGVAEGLYGKDSAPVDFNRDWSAYPKRAEIKALREAMDKSRAESGGKDEPMFALLDLHAPGPSGVSFPVPPHPAWAGRDAWQRAWWLAKLIERHSSDDAPIRWANCNPEHIDWSPPGTGPQMATAFHPACGLADNAMTIERS